MIQGIMDLLFENNFNMYLFIFWMGLFIAESYYFYTKRRNGIERSEGIFAVWISTIFAIVMLANSTFTEYTYKAFFKPKKDICLLKAYENSWCNPDAFFVENVKKAHMSGRIESESYQVLFLLFVFLFGWMICYVASDKNNLLNCFMAYPVGIAFASSLGLFFFLTGIPINKLTIIIAVMLLFLSLATLMKKKNITLNRNVMVKTFLFALLIACFAVWSKIYYISPDSIIKTFGGVQFAVEKLSRAQAIKEVEYGLVEPLIHCLGWNFSIDFVYGMYIIMPISCAGILFSLLFQKKKEMGTKNDMGFFIGFIGIIVLMTNSDFLKVGIWILSNGMMACFYLILLVALKLSVSDRGNYLNVISFVSMAMIISRIEASVYICLLFILICGIEGYNKIRVKYSVVVAAEIMVWQVYLLIYAPRGMEYWTPLRSIITITGSLAVLIAPYVVMTINKNCLWLYNHFFVLSVLFFVLLASALFVIGPKTTFQTASVFLGHFATSIESNSVAIWGYITLMMPLLLVKKDKFIDFLAAFVLNYLILTFVIFTFRKGNMIHEEISDSCRRMIVQIMPTCIFFAMCLQENVLRDSN